MILFVVEGARAEPRYLDNIQNSLFSEIDDVSFVKISKEGTIHSIAKQIAEDPNLDTFSLILSFITDSEIKEGLQKQRKYVSEIYFVFDYDGHAHDSVDANLKICLETLCNETEEGKLYISYPMVEANRHIKCEESFCNSSYPLDKCSEYKNYVHGDSDFRFQRFSEFTKKDWIFICLINVKKANFIVNGSYDLPEEKYYLSCLKQSEIFINQKNKMIDPAREVFVLGSFPFFIVDYFGYSELGLIT